MEAPGQAGAPVGSSRTLSVLHPATRPGPIHLRVASLDRVVPFYRDVLGLEPMEGPGSGGGSAVALRPPTGETVVVLNEAPGAPFRPLGTTGLYHVAFLFPHRAALGAALRRLLDRGYPLDGVADHLVSEALYLHDPEGNGIELYADRPRSGWYGPDGRIRMATLPLDLDDLLAVAATGEGADPGTRVGHVHLNVADLERSRRFYGDLLGFDVMLRYGPSALFVSVGGYHHHLGFNTWEGEGAPQPPAGSTGLISYVLWVPPEGFDSLVDRLREAGAPFSTVDSGRFASRPADPRRKGTTDGKGGPAARAGDPVVDAGERGVELTDPDGIRVVLATRE